MDFIDIFQEMEQETLNLNELKLSVGDVWSSKGHRPKTQMPRDFDDKPAYSVL